MEQKKLIEFVESVAEIKILKPATSPTMRLDDTHQNDVKVGDEWIHINKDANPTLGFKLVKMKPVQRLCELGCGDIIANQIVEKRLCHTPVTHWRTRCDTCGCFVSPDGEGFIEGGHQIQAAYMNYFRDKKREFKEANSSSTKPVEPGVRGDSEIKVYERSKPRQWVTDADGNIRLKE